jgi:hypothetical protein
MITADDNFGTMTTDNIDSGAETEPDRPMCAEQLIATQLLLDSVSPDTTDPFAAITSLARSLIRMGAADSVMWLTSLGPDGRANFAHMVDLLG